MTTPFRESPAPPEDAIRSIRVASTLVERFRAIVSTDPSSIADLELRIGESQQIYPEIWRHLDDARRALVARGTDVGRFDALRRSELVALGVTDVEITRELDTSALILGRVRYTATKTASFNVGGAQRAAAAARALMDALPEVDWVALARAEDREIAAAGSMQTSKYVGILKVAAAAAAVVVVAIVIHRLATDVREAPPGPPPPKQFDFYRSAQYTFAKLREERITELRAMYAATCDPALQPELVRLLRDDGQTSTAAKYEHDGCTRTLPSCERFYVPIEDRLLTRYGLGRDRVLDFACRGIVIGATGGLHTAFAVSITGRGPDKQLHTYRGVVADDGERDLVPFEQAPVPAFVGTGDLDGDRVDELVMVGGTRLVVTRIAGDHFVDLAGPALHAGCQANVNVERDLREEGKPSHDSLVIAVDDPHPKRGCPEAGRHFYVLAGDTIREDD